MEKTNEKIGNKETNGIKTNEIKDINKNQDEKMNIGEIKPVDHIQVVEEVFNDIFLKYGLEYASFKVGWYNEQVSKFFQLPYHPDTLAYVIISAPSMFEKCFVPFVEDENSLRSTIDPLDQCMKYHFNLVGEKLPQYNVEAIHDFEMTPMKRPRVLVQTAGHVSGAVRYYQRKDLVPDPWPSSKKMFGVCIHPQHGGWMALRGVVIFSDVQCPHLVQRKPCEILNTQEDIQELLRRFNECWQDWSFRDIIDVKEKYSELQKEYFSTNPADRTKILDRLRKRS